MTHPIVRLNFAHRPRLDRGRGKTEEEILKQAAEHAPRDHGVVPIDPGTLSKVKAAIGTA
jgi:predicted small metal-binding protein